VAYSTILLYFLLGERDRERGTDRDREREIKRDRERE
jgi:hypothetical protein